MGRRGRVFSRRRDPRNDLTLPRNYPGSCSQQRSTASSGPRRPCAYNWLRGPATTEIDSPHLRGRRRLNRRVHLILSQSPSTNVNAWEFTGNGCGNRVGNLGIGSGFPEVHGLRRRSPLLGPRHRDIRGHYADYSPNHRPLPRKRSSALPLSYAPTRA